MSINCNSPKEYFFKIVEILDSVEKSDTYMDYEEAQGKLDQAYELLGRVDHDYPEHMNAFFPLITKHSNLYFVNALKKLENLNPFFSELKRDPSVANKSAVMEIIHSDVQGFLERLPSDSFEHCISEILGFLALYKHSLEFNNKGNLERARNNLEVLSEQLILRFPDMKTKLQELPRLLQDFFRKSERCSSQEYDSIQTMLINLREEKTKSIVEKLKEQHQVCRQAFASTNKKAAVQEIVKLTELTQKAISAFPELDTEIVRAQSKLLNVYENSEFEPEEVPMEEPQVEEPLVISCSDLFWKGVEIIKKPFEVIDESLSKKDL